MSRRPSAPRTPSSAATPYPRRTPGQPKSSRQQFSACGACRMRRVRCDLKEFNGAAAPDATQQRSCSNCKERSIKCVDEFAEVKAVKLLRRGRRLQQVEAVYGKASSDPAPIASQDLTSAILSSQAPATAHGRIPQMQLSFLDSSFFRQFCVQHPVIDPAEFASRYIAHMDGTAPLNIEGEMLAMLLVAWAAAFGVDESGNEHADSGPSESHINPSIDSHSDPSQQADMLRAEPMVRELLTLVDLHALLRRPSWDGVRVLLLLLPLADGIQTRIEHTTTFEAALSQVYSLCNVDNPPPINSGLGPYCDVLVRARIFWYAHVHEGITTGLEGGRILLDDDDLASFQSTLPPHYCASAPSNVSRSADPSRPPPATGSPTAPTFPSHSPLEPNHPRAALAYLVTSQHFSLTLAVSQVCRSIHATLTGPRARRRMESGLVVRKEAVIEIWDSLERCWDNFETLRRNPSGVGVAGGDLVRGEDIERFVSGWQILIFRCLNVVREALFHSTHKIPADNSFMAGLRLSAVRRCLRFLPRVITMLQRHLKVPSNFFAYDTGLIRDGCFFAGLLLAQSDQLDIEKDMLGWDTDWEEGVMACLQALGEIRRACSPTQERIKSLRMELKARVERETSRWERSPTAFSVKRSPGSSPCLSDNVSLPCSTAPCRPRKLSLVSAGGQVRPYLPPLSVSFPRDNSGPDTVLTDDGPGSWEPYTPPSTSVSMAGMVMAHRSLSPSSSPYDPALVSTLGALKVKGTIFGDDDDQFSFTVGGSPGSQTSEDSVIQARWTPFSYSDPHVVLGYDGGFSSLGSTRRTYIS